MDVDDKISNPGSYPEIRWSKLLNPFPKFPDVDSNGNERGDAFGGERD